MLKRLDNVLLLGTSHVAKKSAKEIEKVIDEYSPEIICIELDENRLRAILNNSPKRRKGRKEKTINIKIIKEIGVGGYLFGAVAGFIQKKIGKSIGIEPGVDMKKAYLIAKKKNLRIELIDLDIKKTLKKMSKLSFSRKIKMFANLLFKSFKKEYRNKLNFDIKKGVPNEEVIEFAMKVFRIEVPDLYKILIEDRNIHMGNRILNLRKESDGFILAVVGAGHLKGMYEYLEKKINESEKII